MTKRAAPEHTIIRYWPSHRGAFYPGWRPVEILRWRLFVNATHEEVTGEKHGAPWSRHWSCERLNADGRWWITGRQDWATLEEAQVDTSADTFATFAEALDVARRTATEFVEHCVQKPREAEFSLGLVNTAKAPELPT